VWVCSIGASAAPEACADYESIEGFGSMKHCLMANGTPRTGARCSGNGAIGKFFMPSQSETRPEGRSEVNLKTHFAPNSNTAKKPDDSSDDPMTGAQASHLKALSEECGEPDWRQSGSTRSRRSEDLRNNGNSL
jgi:hypothetical protein